MLFEITTHFHETRERGWSGWRVSVSVSGGSVWSKNNKKKKKNAKTTASLVSAVEGKQTENEEEARMKNTETYPRETSKQGEQRGATNNS